MTTSPPTLPDPHLDRFETFAVELAHAAGAAILPLFRADHGLEDKGAVTGRVFDPVTEADKGAERAIRAAISAAYPDHGVIGEEYGEDRPDAEFVWVLDPIDGTRAFISGLPLWTTLIALRHQGQPVVGVISQPFIGEVFVGEALIRRSVALDENAAYGLGHVILGAYHARIAGAELDESWKHFQRALQLTGGRSLMAKFQLAKTYYCMKADKAGYEKTLNEVVEAGDTLPEQRLQNTIAKRRARRYLGKNRESNCGF